MNATINQQITGLSLAGGVIMVEDRIRNLLVGKEFSIVKEYTDGLEFVTNNSIVSILHSTVSQEMLFNVDLPDEFLLDSMVKDVKVTFNPETILVELFSVNSECKIEFIKDSNGYLGLLVKTRPYLPLPRKIIHYLLLVAEFAISIPILKIIWYKLFVGLLGFQPLSTNNIVAASVVSAIIVSILNYLGLFDIFETDFYYDDYDQQQ